MVRAGRARAGAVAGAALLVAVAAACSPAAAPGTPLPTAVVVPQADCLAPAVLDRLGLTLDPSLAARATHAPDLTAGRVPAGFVATSVVQCQVGGQMRDSAGTWTAVTVTSREGSAADVAALVAALDGTARRTGAADVATSCGPDAAPVVLWLLDTMDRAVLSDVAVDGCGGVGDQVRAALERIPVTGAVDQPVALVAAAR
ncbi:MAG: hypothetical protein BGO37_04970 [Cellulomonas sp. 73-92]|uniref:hypothetical protein n=1 Tax=Cellulomonas sp. 73-92 TaxID=1895740 RepID=UPI00092B5F41|nr:hypothetical protein [Cellulomonas sp. 73-92]OJV82331.1 MAG: hypothetical protein BGO37_04970 [Cellulomonas sp. 73-92]